MRTNDLPDDSVSPQEQSLKSGDWMLIRPWRGSAGPVHDGKVHIGCCWRRPQQWRLLKGTLGYIKRTARRWHTSRPARSKWQEDREQRGGKASRAPHLNPVKKPTEPQVLIRMAGNVLCIFLCLWTQSGMTGSALEQSKPHPVPAWVFNNYWWQFKNTTAHINNETNGYACDATGYTFFWTVAL